MTKHTDEETLANALIMTGCKDAADLIDMANVGRSMMERMAQVTEDGPLKGWAPADDPAEIVTDLRNALDDALHDYGNAESECKAAEARVEELEAAPQAAEARARTAETDRDEWKSQFDTSERVIAELTNDLAVANITIAKERERARMAEEALKALRTQADNAAWNAHRSGVTIDNAQLVRIFEGMVEQADAAINAKKEANRG